MYGVERRSAPYIFCKFPPSFAILVRFYPFLRILTKKLGKAAKQFTSTTRFSISFFSLFFFFLFSWTKSIKARTPDGVVETQFLQNFGPFCANFRRWYFSKSIELRRSTFHRTISMRSLKSALKDHKVGNYAVYPMRFHRNKNKNRKLSPTKYRIAIQRPYSIILLDITLYENQLSSKNQQDVSKIRNIRYKITCFYFRRE